MLANHLDRFERNQSYRKSHSWRAAAIHASTSALRPQKLSPAPDGVWRGNCKNCQNRRPTLTRTDLRENDKETTMVLNNKRLAVLVEAIYEDQELWYPVQRLREANATVTIVGPEGGKT